MGGACDAEDLSRQDRRERTRQQSGEAGGERREAAGSRCSRDRETLGIHGQLAEDLNQEGRQAQSGLRKSISLGGGGVIVVV